MSTRQQESVQGSMWIAHNSIQGAPGYRYYEKLNELLREAKFDRQVKAL